MTHPDKALTFRAIGTAIDLEQLRELKARMESGDKKPEIEGGGEKKSFFMDVYAASTREYMKVSGATAETFADIAVKSHAFGALNPKAQFHERVTREQVLAAREVSAPLTVLMCSPIGDGAAAAVLMSEKYARRLGIASPVEVRASVIFSGRDRAAEEPTALERVAKRAYEIGGIGPSDINLIEVHDAAAPAELIACEELGICARGEGPRVSRERSSRSRRSPRRQSKWWAPLEGPSDWRHWNRADRRNSRSAARAMWCPPGDRRPRRTHRERRRLPGAGCRGDVGSHFLDLGEARWNTRS
jgi:hypothetical protein